VTLSLTESQVAILASFARQRIVESGLVMLKRSDDPELFDDVVLNIPDIAAIGYITGGDFEKLLPAHAPIADKGDTAPQKGARAAGERAEEWRREGRQTYLSGSPRPPADGRRGKRMQEGWDSEQAAHHARVASDPTPEPEVVAVPESAAEYCENEF